MTFIRGKVNQHQDPGPLEIGAMVISLILFSPIIITIGLCLLPIWIIGYITKKFSKEII